MSEGHKLFGFGEKRSHLDAQAVEVLRTRETVMKGGEYWVALAVGNSRPDIKARVDEELSRQQSEAESASPEAAMPYPQEADHQLLANAAVAASLGVANMPETLDLHGQDAALDTDKFVNGKQSGYELVG